LPLASYSSARWYGNLISRRAFNTPMMSITPFPPQCRTFFCGCGHIFEMKIVEA
jgi:hypothetical protein